MGITGPENLTANIRNIHDNFLDKLEKKHEEEREKIRKLLSLKKLRLSMEGLLDEQIQKAAKITLKAHLKKIEAAQLGKLDEDETLEPFLSIDIDIERLAAAAWKSAPRGLQKEYSSKDLTWAMALLLEEAGYFVQPDGNLSMDIPLTDEAAAQMIADEEDIDDDQEIPAIDEDIDQELPGLDEDDPDKDNSDDSGEVNEA